MGLKIDLLGRAYTELFLLEFKMRLSDIYKQSWDTDKQRLQKLMYYNMYKYELSLEPYLLLEIPRTFKRALCKFRLGNCSLEIELGRHAGLCKEDRLCILCGRYFNIIAIECEFHFLF